MKKVSNVKPRMKFPDDFYWGASTAAYQVEGYNENTDWAVAAKDRKVPPAGRLADHYHLYEKDFDIAKELKHNAHRFSVEWARIEPEEGQFDPEAVEHYKKVLQALKKRKITPFITLWHFTLPLWLAEKGGCESKEFPELFARYCGFVVKEIGDLCEFYATINEPNVYATHCYLYGAWPPFKRAAFLNNKVTQQINPCNPSSRIEHPRIKNYFAYLTVLGNLIKAHNLAYDAIKKSHKKASVSVVKHVHFFNATKNPINFLKAWISMYMQTYYFLNRTKHKTDIIGLNYYRHTTFGDTQNYLLTDMNWKVKPEGIYGAIMALKRYKKPIIIAEAGVADEDDDIRPDYIRVQIAATQKALEDGADVRGHMYWSLLDNYEWAFGTERRFGLVAVDYKTLERTIRPSAQVYKQIIENNGIL